jgi:CheY-like chemotaxis protein
MQTATPKTVLIADDNALVLSTFRLAFEQRGHRVLTAEDGGVALSLVYNQPIDVLFLDILMPEMDGLETLIQIRQRFPDLSVYVMSGGAGGNKVDLLSIAKKFGATGTIKKPVLPAELITLIEQPIPKRKIA